MSFKVNINGILSEEDEAEIGIIPIAGAEVNMYLPLKICFSHIARTPI
jgi:hypothetical protein